MSHPVSLFANQLPGLLRLARLRAGRLEQLTLHRPDDPPATGSIFMARVTDVHPGMQAAFCEVGDGMNVFLDRGNLAPGTLPSKKASIESVVKPGRELLVQLRKPAVGDKLAQVSANLKIVGWRLIYLPMEPGVRFSRDFDGDRHAVKQLFSEMEGGWLIRAAAAVVRPEVLQAEAQALQDQYKQCRAQAEISGKPRLLVAQDPILTALRDIGLTQLHNLHLDNEEQADILRTTFLQTAPELAQRLTLHTGDLQLFDVYKIESQIDDLRSSKVWLKSGGWLQLHQTEAMVTIDVNSGKQGKARGGKSPALRTNLEAAAETANQLRARNLAGLVVIDFINAPEKDWRTRIDSALKTALRDDPAKVEALHIDRFGLARLSRERIGPDLGRIFTQPCRSCGGTGRINRVETIAADIQRYILRESTDMEGETYQITCGQSLADYLSKHHELIFAPIEQLSNITIQVEKRHEMQPRAWKIALD